MNHWQSWFKNQDQQGYQHWQNQNYEAAEDTFNDSQWKVSSAYKRGDYEAALAAFRQGKDANAYYNQGNALVKTPTL